ncbi:hypothetical protein [Calothrix sp. NIES-3974]|uniref:hypothetical protein n=1 Tax=Calothrix sp. NIES-3974 TaxID=2005462 RepID=UPI000B5EDF64|nr:hypothetical protein [Calothrix sp. NIES-3974]BAZ06363.1 hypothetical protein NIES3974_30240 [Calothrix sp. NIES-3974]
MGKYFQLATLPQRVAIALVLVFSMLLGACGSGGEQQADQSADTTDSQTSASTDPSTNGANSQQNFNDPVVAGKGTDGLPTSVAAAPNLIQPTNPTERAVVVDRGRSDPFAQIVNPQFITQPGSNQAQTPNQISNQASNPRRLVPTVPNLPANTTRITSGNQGKRIQRSQVASARLPKPPQIRPVMPSAMPPVVADPSLTAALPPTPQPETARAVVVSGVVMVGNQAQAIIKVPNEPSSRYVQVGDRLSNGVLVKRIEMNAGSDPVVIFEQFGIEVAKMVGEGAATTTAAVDSNTPTPPNVPTGAS